MRRDELELPAPPPNDRPGDRWMCGRSGEATACSQGPNVSGIEKAHLCVLHGRGLDFAVHNGRVKCDGPLKIRSRDFEPVD